MKTKIYSFVAVARPKQWIKQVIILLPLISEGNNLEFNKILDAFAAVFIFTLGAAGVYFLNDYQDYESDKLDSIKKSRPIASGKVKRSSAVLIAILLFTISLLLSALLTNGKLTFAILFFYLIMNVCYSVFKLKKYGNLGAFVVACGFPLRWAFGSIAINASFSWWAFFMIAQLSLFMLAGKRFQTNQRSFQSADHEIVKALDFWLLSLVIYASLFLTTYASFIGQSNIQETWSQWALLGSTLPIGLGLVRYLEIVTHPEKYKSEDATESMVRDKVLIILGLIYVLVMFFGRLSNG